MLVSCKCKNTIRTIGVFIVGVLVGLVEGVRLLNTKCRNPDIILIILGSLNFEKLITELIIKRPARH